ncbi:MAG: AAA family ATPase [Steroidobacteraceae bacterium]
MSTEKTPINPFRYGREVALLVDRADEVARIVRIGENCGTLFFIGPRRYGKTSILRAADDAVTKAGIVVLRYDAEAFENVGLLAAALMTGALRKYASALDRAQAAAKKFFSALKPSLSIDPADGKITVGMGFDPAARHTQVPLLTDVLNGIERLAAADQRKALVILDEFQQVVSEAGEKTERQIRAAVQTHHDVGYVFAGSSTRMMTDMISTSARAFWNLGDQMHLGPIPRRDFIPFLRSGLESAGATVAEEALLRILDLSEDVPYNVQQLASQCFTLLRDSGRRHLSSPLVDDALGEVIAMQHVSYLQRWLSLSTAQKRALKVVIEERGEFQLAEAARRHGLPRTTMQRALQVLQKQHFLRQDFARTGVVWRLEDPFLRRWLIEFQAQ